MQESISGVMLSHTQIQPSINQQLENILGCLPCQIGFECIEGRRLEGWIFHEFVDISTCFEKHSDHLQAVEGKCVFLLEGHSESTCRSGRVNVGGETFLQQEGEHIQLPPSSAQDAGTKEARFTPR